MALDDTADETLADEESPLRKLLAGIERGRKLTVWSILALAIGTLVSWNFARQIFAFLVQPLTRELLARGDDPRLAFTGLTDPFILYFTVSLFGGLTLATPVLMGQLYVVIAPRLRRRNAAAIAVFALAATALFLGGLAFCYTVLLPFSVRYLLGVGGDFESVITVRDFLRFAIRLLVALGLAAELPLVSLTASRMGLVTARTLWRWFPYAAIAAVVLGAWVTPPDMISQLLVAGPLLALYLVGILVAAVAGR